MSQSLARILLHIIFSTKNREPYFGDQLIRKNLNAYLAATTNHLGSASISAGGVDDHVHLVCALGRTLRVASLLQNLKVSSIQEFKGNFPSLFSLQIGYVI